MRILAVDYGDARTGLALCDPGGSLASPLAVIEEKSERELVKKIAALASQNGARLIVVGYPRNMDGSGGPRAQKCEAFAKSLESFSKIKTALWDERLTTKSALAAMNVTGTRGKKRKAAVDSAAACIILQDYLDHLKNIG